MRELRTGPRVGWRLARAAGAALAIALASAPGVRADDDPWHAERARYGMSAPQQHMVAMSDGVTLAVDVYRPTRANGSLAAGPFPVILSQTPYGKRSVVTTQSMGQGLGGDGYYPYLIERGYINVVADVRGTGSSNGDFSLFGPREKQDGVELAAWAAQLRGSDRRVGLAGSSYLGLNQIFTAALAGPHSPVRAIIPSAVGNDLYRDLAFGGGIPNLEFATVWEGLRASMTAALPDQPSQDPKTLIDHPTARAMTLAELDAQLYAEADLGGPRAFDSYFWQTRAPSAYLGRIVRNGIPALIVDGWHDVYQRGAVLDFAGLQNAYSRLHGGPGRDPALSPPMAAGERPTGRYQLVSGPWFHNPTTLGLRFQQLQLAWFDRWLKGMHTGIDRTSTPLHAYELGANRWIEASSWPLRQTRARTLYLGGGGGTEGGGGTGSGGGTEGGGGTGGGGGLAGQRPRASSADRLPWSDLRSPCNAGTDQWNTGFQAYAIAELGGSGDPCADDDRTTQAAALTYTSSPFKTASTIAGPIDATLYLTANRADAELVAAVEVVSPDGSSRELSTGALLGSLRGLDSRRSWREDGHLILPWHPYTSAGARDLRPNTVERLDVEIYPTLARIAPGDRLRLTLTAGDTALQPSPVQITRLAGGVYSIERGGGHASTLTLPLVPSRALPTSPIDWGGCNGSC